MPPSIDLDSVRIHAQTAATLAVVGSLTSGYAFHSPHSRVVPYVLLSGFALLLALWCGNSREATPVGRLKDCGVLAGVVWWGWLAYGSIWEREHRLEGRREHLLSAAYAACGYWTVLRSTGRQPKPVYYAAVLSAYGVGALIPMRSNVAQYLPAWDAALHVVVYLWTYFFTLYASVATGMDPHPARVICASMWVLLVNSWWLPVAVPLWALQLRELSESYWELPTIDHRPAPPPPEAVSRSTPPPPLNVQRSRTSPPNQNAALVERLYTRAARSGTGT